MDETVKLTGGTVKPLELVTIHLASGDVSVTSDGAARWEYTLSLVQHNVYVDGADPIVRISSEGQNRYITYPDVNAPRLLPKAGNVLDGSTHTFTAFPLVSTWLYRFDVDGVNGEFGPSNVFNATNLPVNGRGVPVNLRIDMQDGSEQIVITNEYVAANLNGLQYSIAPANGAQLTSGIQEFVITPKNASVRCRANVDGSTGQYGSNNVITSAVPVDGEDFTVVFEIDEQDGGPVIEITRTYTAFDASNSYAQLDVERAVASAVARNASGDVITQYTAGQEAFIWIELVDTNGVHINDQTPIPNVRNGSISTGDHEGFVRQEGLYSIYRVLIPQGVADTDVVFTVGVYNGAGNSDTNALLATFTLPLVTPAVTYTTLDVARAEQSAVARNATGGIISGYTSGQEAFIWIELVDTNGVHINDQTLPFGIRNGEISFGSENFVRQEGTFSIYRTVPPSSSTNINVTFTVGVYLDGTASDNNALIASFTLPLSETDVSAALANVLTLPSNRPVFNRSDWETMAAPQSSIFWENAADAFSSVATVEGESALCLRLVGDSGGSSRIGSGFRVPPAQVYTLTQRAYLDANFDWGGTNEGGKLGFGLAGGSRPSGGNATSTGFNQNGFSFRYMWRTNGEIDMYTYDADTRGFGTSNYTGAFMPRGQWFQITMEVTMSSGKGANDGRGRAWLNGALIYDSNNHRWFGATSSEPVQVDAIQHFTFHGGADASWGPQNGKVNEAYFNTVSYEAAAAM